LCRRHRGQTEKQDRHDEKADAAGKRHDLVIQGNLVQRPMQVSSLHAYIYLHCSCL
jgi:hypothetical protein